MAEKTISTAQRMMNFAALTRQNKHMIPSQEATTEYSALQFTLPKARVLAKTYLKVDVDCTLKHASETTFTPAQAYDLIKVIRKITMDVNVGFMPVSLTGEELAIFNTITTHPDKIIGGGNRLISKDTLTASAAGAANSYSFVLEVKNTLNDNALQGLIMLQNQSTTVTMNIDLGAASDIIGGQAGFSGTLDKVKITPCLVTYTIPKQETAMPDISVLKVVHSKTESFPSAGAKTIYLDCGMVYRKIILKFEDADGAPLSPEAFAGNFELAFNTADVPYSISPDMLYYMNIDELGQPLPDGIYLFDFSSSSPLIGHAGNRDYIDSSKLTSFTLGFNTTEACKATVISERISLLKA